MKYFSITELTRSATARRLGIDNTPTAKVSQSLKALVDNILDPLREAWGAPVIVTSGYRCPKLNQAVGGSVTSQHQTGEAADIRTLPDSESDNLRLIRLIVRKKLPFDQLIWEYGSDNGPDWIHVSYRPDGRRQILRARRSKGKTVYNTIIIK